MTSNNVEYLYVKDWNVLHILLLFEKLHAVSLLFAKIVCTSSQGSHYPSCMQSSSCDRTQSMGAQAVFTKPEHFKCGFISSPKPKSQGELL